MVQLPSDVVLIAISVAMLGFSLYAYLWIRRTVTAFGEGYKQGKD